jgi:hypothetical protein|tara:strand:- start:690 stop:947 length:258 start_codon:yes stop_codon:yes gene_type:complete
MKIKGAMTILERRANFYGKTVDWLIDAMDNHMDEGLKVTEAYEVYKMDQGLVWCGVNGVGFTTPENSSNEWKLFRGEGVQLELTL